MNKIDKKENKEEKIEKSSKNLIKVLIQKRKK